MDGRRTAGAVKKALARGYTVREIDRNLLEIICQLIERRCLDFFMYDTFLGAKPGLRDFKRRTGFRPYRARYSTA